MIAQVVFVFMALELATVLPFSAGHPVATHGALSAFVFFAMLLLGVWMERKPSALSTSRPATPSSGPSPDAGRASAGRASGAAPSPTVEDRPPLSPETETLTRME